MKEHLLKMVKMPRIKTLQNQGLTLLQGRAHLAEEVRDLTVLRRLSMYRGKNKFTKGDLFVINMYQYHRHSVVKFVSILKNLKKLACALCLFLKESQIWEEDVEIVVVWAVPRKTSLRKDKILNTTLSSKQKTSKKCLIRNKRERGGKELLVLEEPEVLLDGQDITETVSLRIVLLST